MLVNVFFFFNDTATSEIYPDCNALSLHDALPICTGTGRTRAGCPTAPRRSTEAPMSEPAPRRTEYLPLDHLTPDPSNPKAHDLAVIDASVGRFGMID